MKIKTESCNRIILEEVFNPITLVSSKKEKISIVMRDSGFELWYEDKEDGEHHEYEFKNGVVRKIKELTMDNDTNDILIKTNKMEAITKSNTSQYPSVKTEIVLDNTHNGARQSFSYDGELKDEHTETKIMEMVKNLKVGQVLTIKPIYDIEKSTKNK